jgi:hypothetical protein
VAMRDSIFNEGNTARLVRTEMNFEFSKRENEARLQEEKREALAQASSKKRRAVIFWSAMLLLLICGFGFFIYRSLLNNRRINLEVTGQKRIIEEKQRTILDSINYARRIQLSLITPVKYIEKTMVRLKEGGS